MVNTKITENAFRIERLQAAAGARSTSSSRSCSGRSPRREAPGNLHRRRPASWAWSDGGDPAYIRLQDGKIIGIPKPGAGAAVGDQRPDRGPVGVPPRTPDPRRDPPAARRTPPRAARPADDDSPAPARSGRGGIFEAQAYTPRGRSVREQARTLRPGPRRRTPEPAPPSYGWSTAAGPTTPRPASDGVPTGSRGEPDRRAAARSVRDDDRGRGTGTARGRHVRADDRVRPPSPARRPADRGRGDEGRQIAGRGAAAADVRAGRRPDRRPTKGRPTAPRPPLRRKPRARPKLADPNRRLRLGAFLALAMFACIGIRLVTLQVLPTPAYADGGIQDRLRSVTLFASRGGIYDRSGVPLTHSVEARYVYADPEMVKNPGDAAAKLSPLLGVARSDLEKRMAKRKLDSGIASRSRGWPAACRSSKAKQVMALNIAGIGIGARRAPGDPRPPTWPPT